MKRTLLLERFNPLHPDVQADPYPFYARYREQDPVHLALPPVAGDKPCWYVFRFADVVSVLKDPRFTKESLLSTKPLWQVPGRMRSFPRMVRDWMLLRDPPEHTRLRSSVQRSFSAAAVESRAPAIREAAEALLDEATGVFDLVNDYAVPLAVGTIAEMLGLPPGRREDLTRWSGAIGATIAQWNSRRAWAGAGPACEALAELVQPLIEERRREPRDDLLSSLVAQQAEGRLSEHELKAMCSLLLVAGHGTTAHLIGNGTLALLQHPGELERLRADPDLMDGAVVELLRYDSPIQIVTRIASEDVELGGKTIRAGQMICAVLGSANRDPDVFAAPDRLDITRDAAMHSAFGHGPHYCVGAALGRLEGRIGIETLLRRMPTLRLRTETPEWSFGTMPNAATRGLKALPVSA